MGIVSAKCPQCGANLNVDDTKDAGICPSCGTPFITEKAINNYIIHNHNTTNVDNQTNVYLNENLFDKEKRECELLLMLLQHYDVKYLKAQTLEVLRVNPKNSLAQMIYDCDFSIVYYNKYSFFEFDEQPLHRFLQKECGNIDYGTSIFFLMALLLKVSNDENVPETVNLIFENISRLKLNNHDLYKTYLAMSTEIGNVENIKSILNDAQIVDSSFYKDVREMLDASEKNQIADSMFQARRKIALTFSDIVRNSNLNEAQKKEILSKIIILLTGTASNTNNTTQAPKRKLSPAIWVFLVLFVGIPVGIAIYFLFINL